MKAFRFELTRVQSNAVRTRVVASLMNVDRALANAVAEGLGIPLPAALPMVLADPREPEVEASPRLSLFARPGDVGVRTRRIAILVAAGVSGVEEIHTALAQAGAVPRLVAAKLGVVTTADDTELPVDISLEAAPSVLFDALVIPECGDGLEELKKNGHVGEFVKDQFRHCKTILAVGSSSELLESLGVFATLPSGEADPGLVLAPAQDLRRGVSAFVAAAARHRHYQRETDPPSI
jgi:catalase